MASALTGGILIGLATSLLWVFNGRTAGISGILNGALTSTKDKDAGWRWAFLAGLLTGGSLLAWLRPVSFAGQSDFPFWQIGFAGVLVGYGALLANGCTSGHGVCGIGRLSIRSLTATVVFILAGAASVVFLRSVGVLP
ncbi:YeeE/YedE family protein [bacterium]|nr:YeeE/YedE family protein [bacterium]